MLTRKESLLQADAVNVFCPPCADEYTVYVSWGAWDTIVDREKDCACLIDPAIERAAIAAHFADPPESNWAAQYQVGNGGLF
jgi:hypothetical protein